MTTQSEKCDVSIIEGESDASDMEKLSIAARCLNAVKSITVEPAVISTMFIATSHPILAKEYIYQRIASDYHLYTNATTNSSCSELYKNHSDPQYILEQQVSSETSTWALYLGIATFVPELFSSIILGSWGDRVGRKPPIVISLFGFIVLTTCYLMVIIFDLPLHFLLIGHIANGIFGDFGTLLGCSSSYLSDVTSPEKRAFRLGILETGMGIGAFIASMTSGLWDLNKGFLTPYACMIGFALCNFVFTICFLRSSDGRKTTWRFGQLFSKEPFVHMYKVIRPHPDNRHITLLLFATCFCFLVATATGSRGLLVVYTIGMPFCWGPLLIGLFTSLGQVGYFVSLVVLKIFPDFSLQPRLVMLGIVTTIVSSLLLTFSKTTLMIFLAQCFQIIFNLPSPIIRSQASRIVSRDEVGSVFAVLACAMAIGEIIGTFVYQGVFTLTAESDFPGSVFLVATSLLLSMIPLYCIGYCVSAKLRQPCDEKAYNVLTEDTEDDK